MRVYVCDDTEADREILKKYFFTYADGQNIEFAICEASSGVDTAKRIYDKGFGGTLIFTTTSKDYGYDGFCLGVDGYLHKPYQFADFAKILERCKRKWQKSLKSITVTSERVEFPVLLMHIETIESIDHRCMIYGKGGELKVWQTLTQLAASLAGEPSFIRCGRSYLVNLAFVAQLQEDGNLLLKSGRRIPVPVKERTRMSALLSEYSWTALRELGGGYE